MKQMQMLTVISLLANLENGEFSRPRKTSKCACNVLILSVDWKYFAFPVTYNDSGVRVVDKKVTVCKLCCTRKAYDDGNTSSMGSHLTRHHPDKVTTGAYYD